MKKCVKIMMEGNFSSDFMQNTVQEAARSCDLEGTVQQAHDGEIRVVVCGTPESIDKFIDLLHESPDGSNITSFQAEPFLKDKDYRGVFRLIG